MIVFAATRRFRDGRCAQTAEGLLAMLLAQRIAAAAEGTAIIASISAPDDAGRLRLPWHEPEAKRGDIRQHGKSKKHRWRGRRDWTSSHSRSFTFASLFVPPDVAPENIGPADRGPTATS